MNLQQMEYIIAVEQHRHFGKAAAACFVTQPTLSMMIQKLEDELGIAIFERSGKRFTGVTEPGKVVLRIAERILSEAENLKRASAEFATGATGRMV
ncbi:MAG: LysR family transcriptional regulator, partial [Bacteroidota bacterium]